MALPYASSGVPNKESLAYIFPASPLEELATTDGLRMIPEFHLLLPETRGVPVLVARHSPRLLHKEARVSVTAQTPQKLVP